MKKTIIIASSIVFGSIVIGIFINKGLATQRYEYIKENVVFDKKTGTTFLTDKGITSKGSVSPKVVGIK